MAHRTVHRLTCIISLLAVTSAAKEEGRWSRQLDSYTTDLSDWVPLDGPVEREPLMAQMPIKRQAVAEPRILTEPFPGIARPSGFSSDGFSSRNYFNNQANRQPLYLQSVPSVPSAPQNYLNDQGFSQGIRFGLSQPNFPLNQGFIAPPLGFENAPLQSQSRRPQTIQGFPMSQLGFPQASGVPLSLQGKPFANPVQPVKSDIPKFVDGYRAENASNDFSFSSKKRPQSLQKIKFEGGEKVKQEIIPHRSNNEREEVQLLYVPLEQLSRGQFNFRSPLTTSQLVNTEMYSQNLPRPNKVTQNFLNDYRPSPKPLDTFSGQNFFSDFNTQIKDLDQVPKFTTHTTPYPTLAPITPKSKKLKPHQPPLAIFMRDTGKNTPLKVGDVLSSLKSAETIAVLDSVNPMNAPKVFIGPSNMPPPENFVKFELPYLSNVDHSDNKLKQLPFFVAPLSYNTPNGFAKIPFPSPHVGSVVINSQIKETTQSQPSQPNVNPNYYLSTYKPEPKPVTQKPTFNYYSTASPTTKSLPNHQSNYYSFEPQTVSSLRTPLQPETQTAPPKSGSYFLSNARPQYNSQEFTNFAPQNNYKSSEITNQFNHPRKPERTTTLRTTTTTTTKQPSTYPSQLLETHNPYSINQAFHFSTPLDYHNYFDDINQPQVTPESVELSTPSPTPNPRSPSTHQPQSEHMVTVKPKYRQQSSPNYLNNYSPEIHYDSDRNTKYPVYNSNDYVTNTETDSQQTQAPNYVDNTQKQKYVTSVDTSSNKHNTNIETSVNQYTNESPEVNNYNVDSYNKYNTNIDTSVNNYKTDSESNVNQYTNIDTLENYKNEYNQNVDTSSPEPGNLSEVNNLSTVSENINQQKYDVNNNYGENTDYAEIIPTPSTSTSTTTTRRTAIRSRGRPRHSTTPRSDSYESTTRVVVSRRPLRERRPQSTRQRYEPNKISTEKPIRKPVDSGESTTKSTKTRTRGRIHYRPSGSDESHDKKKNHNTKEKDLAYQRDVLHQNYPVTLMERASTVDIEAITEPTLQQSSVNLQEHVTETVDTENAYTHERAAISEQEEVKDISPLSSYTPRSTLQTETPYVPRSQSPRNEEYYYQPRSSIAPVEASRYHEAANDKEDDIYAKQTTSVPNLEKTDPIAYATETSATEQNEPNYSTRNDYATIKQEEENTASEVENTKLTNSERTEIEEEENVVQTTPSYNRVRVRPGVIRQYHQTSSSDAPKVKERRRPPQPVTYRPAFDRRRTTMRIDEIEADLKTKQVHARPEQEYKHPVYKPEATTEPAMVSSSTTEITTKRSHLRRRRPLHPYSTSSTEASSTKRSYDVKNRFRGRRPTEKTSEKSDVITEAPSPTTRASVHTRYSHRPRLSERYNKKPEPEVEIEDQDSNFSINRPSYTELEGEHWSPKISSDSFKPFNPNDITDEQRTATTERGPDTESELDIITARNEYDDILLTVTPVSNNRMKKKIPDIPPTLEALVEQSKVTKSDTTDTMSTFESMLEEVMKSLEEQDKDEYNTNVMKHKGGEIGEIPPEIVISSGDSYVPKSTMPLEEVTTELTTADDSPLPDEENKDRKSRRRGFWKKVKVRPATESIEFAESQYYTSTVNRLGQPVKNMKVVHEKTFNDKPKVTTYKPKVQYLTDLFSSGDDFADVDVMPAVDIHKIKSKKSPNEGTVTSEESKKTTAYVEKETQTMSPGDLDLGTGSPDPTVDDMYYSTTNEPVPTKADDRSDTFSFMNYLFGMTSEGSEGSSVGENSTKTTESNIQITTEQPKTKLVTTETGFIPEEITEITASSANTDNTDAIDVSEIQKTNSLEDAKTEKDTVETTFIPVTDVESSSVSSFMDPSNVLSTSMSTEVSHETEICFRGKCIKTSKDIL
ncbi:unnamed protein product [Arctia plantaginis]|uniref:Uncharacterized protein n=1 Tax=Arctia plantaginis TaxID=874455 RepID=A0A8S0ZW04_ARCPL|nr:unnamed protein product [Arctia plantaginis]